MTTVHHRYAQVRGHRLFYREAGPADAPAVVLLHGFPTSSFMFRELIPRLAGHYRVIAPDHLGFGFSDAPGTDAFAYSFDALAGLTKDLLDQLGVTRYALYVQDYGAPIGWRLALGDPGAVTAIVTQNGNGYAAGLVEEFWRDVRAYQDEQTPETEAGVRAALSLEGIKWQYVTGVADETTVSPDTWHHDFQSVSRPGNDLVQLALFRDYATNIALYPRLHEYLRTHPVPVLAVWGANDPIFGPEGARAFAQDAQRAQVHLLDGGHFLLETHVETVAELMLTFLAGRGSPTESRTPLTAHTAVRRLRGPMTAHTGFHEGELAVQRRAGVAREAARLRGMLDRPRLSGAVARFLADRDLAALGARDEDGRLWVSALTGAPGFLSTRDDVVRVAARPRAGDPLAGLATGGAAALIVVDFAVRRRLRLNGTLAAADDAGFELAVDQAYGNCPQYIQQRLLGPAPAGGPAEDTLPPGARAGTPAADRLDAAQAAMVGRADTFFLGTAHPERGADVSHRGGPPGFVRVAADGGLWWPDYPGNNMFNSLGNLAADPAGALLFVDFATGTTLQLSGTAAVDWITPGAPGDDGGTGRRVRFTPRHVAAGRIPVRADGVLPYRLNPPLTG